MLLYLYSRFVDRVVLACDRLWPPKGPAARWWETLLEYTPNWHD
jgi:hypothetical protein